MNIPSKYELQKVALNHSSDISFEDFMNLYRKCTVKPLIDTTLKGSIHYEIFLSGYFLKY